MPVDPLDQSLYEIYRTQVINLGGTPVSGGLGELLQQISELSSGGGGGDLPTELASFSTTLGVDMTDTSSNGMGWNELGDGGIFFADDGGGGFGLASTGFIQFITTGSGCHIRMNANTTFTPVFVFTGASIATLPTVGSNHPAFGFTQDGHIGFNSGSSWSTLV